MKRAARYALAIGGFDPSGGAGLAADLKTFQAHGVQGLGVVTALTAQTHERFESVQWTEREFLLAQLGPLLGAYPVSAVKIGIIRSVDLTLELLEMLQKAYPGVPVVWDPVRSASAGAAFHGELQKSTLEGLLRRTVLVTPNTLEAVWLAHALDAPGSAEGGGSTEEAEVAARRLASYCPVLLKGGHGAGKHSDDLLYSGNKVTTLKGSRLEGSKHGTGCTLASAIAASLAKGVALEAACRSAKGYVRRYLESGEGRRGFHPREA